MALQDLYNAMKAATNAVDNSIAQLASQVPNADVSTRLQIQSEISSLSVKEGQIQGAYIQAADGSPEVVGATAAINGVTANITAETANIVNAASALTSANTILGYVTSIIGILAPLL